MGEVVVGISRKKGEKKWEKGKEVGNSVRREKEGKARHVGQPAWRFLDRPVSTPDVPQLYSCLFDVQEQKSGVWPQNIPPLASRPPWNSVIITGDWEIETRSTGLMAFGLCP